MTIGYYELNPKLAETLGYKLEVIELHQSRALQCACFGRTALIGTVQLLFWEILSFTFVSQ